MGLWLTSRRVLKLRLGLYSTPLSFRVSLYIHSNLIATLATYCDVRFVIASPDIATQTYDS